MQDLAMSLFEPHVGSTFEIVSPGLPVLELTLVQIEDLTAQDRLRDPSIRDQPFSLNFHGPLSPVVPQQILELDHAILGLMQILWFPLAPTKR